MQQNLQWMSLKFEIELAQKQDIGEGKEILSFIVRKDRRVFDREGMFF